MTKDFEKMDKWGECLWSLDENGVLLINEGSAEGISGDNSPWKDFRADIREVSTEGRIDFPKGASLKGLFKGCKNMKKADLSGFNTDNISDMSSMFEACISLEELDLTSFNTLACKNMEDMFGKCGKLTNILIGEAFSLTGDGTTSCNKLAVKDEGRYRRARVISAEGFTVRYHSGTDADIVVERQTVPNYKYIMEESFFDAPTDNSKFIGWRTTPEGEGEVISAGEVIDCVDEDMDVYAVWAYAPVIGAIKKVEHFTFGQPIPFELPEIRSINAPDITGYLEISPTGEEDSWTPIDHNTILPVSCDGYLLRLHASNEVGESVSEPVRLSIGRANIDMSAVRWAEQEDMVYDGEQKKVWVEGLPEGIEPIYTGNTAIDAGSYVASFSFDYDQDNFNEPLIVREHEWTVKKAVLDMSDVRWDYEGAFGYTGVEYRVELKGLPHGVTATYEDNIAKDAGVYTARATLHYDAVNYEKPQDINPCIWEIRKAVIDPSKLVWSSYEDFVYDGTGKSVYITNLPDDVLVEYTGESETLAGKYLARASVRGNYCTTGPAEYEWEISKARYNLSQMTWSERTRYTYDGKTHSVELHCVPEDLEVRYSGNEGISAGTYKARASFFNQDTHNYATPDDIFCDWEIIKREVDMSQVRWSYEGPFTFDGEIKKIELLGLPEGVGAEYEGNLALNAGIYNAQAHLVYDEDNMHAEDPMDCQWKINRKRIDVSDVRWSYTNAFTYDGSEHSVLLENIPEGLKAEYSGNSRVETGKYVASATLVPADPVNYEVPKISGCTWAINKAEAVMNEVEWTDCTDFIYDGKEKKVEIISNLGDAVNVAYSSNTAVNAGRYYAKASFTAVDDANFSAPKDIGHSWEIGKATFDMSGVHWDYDSAFTYDGRLKTVKLVNLPSGVKVSYRNASATDAGAYNAVAEFKVADADNYYDNIPDMILDWSIKKARFDMSNTVWQDEREFLYDGIEKSVRLSGLPEGLEPVYEGNAASGAGKYTAKVNFKYDEKNYERPEVAACHWVIDQSEVDTSAVRWDYEQPFIYDGREKTVEVKGLPEGSHAEYSNASALLAGTYVASVEIVPEDAENRSKKRIENLTWRIEKGDYDMSHVYWDYEHPYVYSGSEYRVILKGYPEGVTPIYRGNIATDAGIYKASVSFKVADSMNYNIPTFEDLEWEIAKNDYDMSNVAWDYDGSIKYDGRMHEVILRGLPDGVRAIYSGNAAADTGSYEAVAELIPYDRDNFNKPTVENCKWQIAKADYEMSAVTWDYENAKIYNGRDQGVMLEHLPNGVSAIYTGNEAKDVGSYTAKAVLSVSDPINYNTPAVSDCDWEIVPAEFDMSQVRWDYSTDKFTFDGKRKSIELVGLPESIEATYQGNSGTRAGEYSATATFTSNDSNFRAPEPFTIPWSISKATHNMHKVHWDYAASFVYDGKPKKVELKDIPEGIKVSYENNEMTDAGTYKAIAYFKTETDDFNVPEEMSCVWTIEKADVDIRELRWDYSQAFVYDGEVKSVKLQGLSELLEASYSGNEATASGSYLAHAELAPIDPANYNTPSISGCMWEITKADYDMTDTRWEGDFETVYDGGERTVVLKGLPEGVTAVYADNTSSEAGEYIAKAELFGDYDNYNVPRVKDCHWRIRKAPVDMSRVAWQEVDDFTYDGEEKTVELVGLPAGIAPVYKGNIASAVGNYEAGVSFEYDERNYEKPEFGNFRWRISRAAIPVDPAEIRWNYTKPFVYDGTEKGISLAKNVQKRGLFERLLGQTDEIKLEGIPEGFDVVYEGNHATEAGVYYASATLMSKDGSNYRPLELPKCKWEIVKAPIDMSKVRWNYSEPFTYDGEEKGVSLIGLPETVTVTYSDNTAVDAGSFEAMAKVEALDPANYEQPSPVSGCWWQIEKATYDMSEARWVYDSDLIYSGKEKKVRVVGLPEGVKVETYTGNKAVEVGSYMAEAKLRYRDRNNYEEPMMPEFKWRIEKRKIDISNVRWDYEKGTLMVYDGQPKEVRLVGVPKEVEVIYIDNSKINAGTYNARARMTYDTRNCEVDDIPDLRWTIEKASYETDNVHWTYERPFEYDGRDKSISLCNLPNSIGVRYRDNRASAIGTYTAKAYLTYDSDNYNEPAIDTTIDWSIVRKLED